MQTRPGVGAAGIGGGAMYRIRCGFEGFALGFKGAVHSLAMGVTRTRVMNLKKKKKKGTGRG